MNSDCIVFCALKLSIENLVRLIFLLRTPILFPSVEENKKRGMKRKGLLGRLGSIFQNTKGER